MLVFLTLILIALLFAAASLAPLLLSGDADAKACILWRR